VRMSTIRPFPALPEALAAHVLYCCNPVKMRIPPCCSVPECLVQCPGSRRESHSNLIGFQQVRYAARERIPVQGIRLAVDKNQLPPVDSTADSSPWQSDGGFRVRVAGKSLQVCHKALFLAAPFSQPADASEACLVVGTLLLCCS